MSQEIKAVWRYIQNLLDSKSLSPHGYCLLWRPELLWTNVISDTLIALAYFSIPAALVYFLVQRRNAEFRWAMWAFAVFIVSCGSTHAMAVWTLWNPAYGVEALTKVVTAGASLLTAAALWPMMPAALAIPSPRELEASNEQLRARIAERDSAIEALKVETAARLEAEELLRHAQKMEAIGQLTGGVAHDFNNLLTIVLASIDRAERKAVGVNEQVKASLETARAGALRAAALTRQLLVFSRREPLNVQEVDMNEVAREAATFTASTLPEAVQLETRLATDLPAITTDRGEALNALVNLINNARDAMEGAKGVIVLQTELAGAGADRRVRVSVRDTGPGMPDDVREKAFEPFFTTKPFGKGSGLGLSQVYGFAKQSGGNAAIESALGKGTTVSIDLPVARDVDGRGA